MGATPQITSSRLTAIPVPPTPPFRNLSSALGSMSPTTSSQILARKRRRGVSLFTVHPFFLGGGGGCFVLLINGKTTFLHFGIYSRNGNVPLCFACFLQIIEKRRRDRINNSLSELRRLVPSAFEKQVMVKVDRALRVAIHAFRILPLINLNLTRALENNCAVCAEEMNSYRVQHILEDNLFCCCLYFYGLHSIYVHIYFKLFPKSTWCQISFCCCCSLL